MNKHLIVFLLLAVVSVPATAQGDYERKMFMDAAGYQSILYRGRQASSYAHIKYNGHCFWLSPQFLLGSVYLNGKQYDDVLLNIDACEQQLLTRTTEASPAIIIPRDRVTSFSIGESKFVNLEVTAPELEAEAGFYQILRAGDAPVIYRSEKMIRTSPDNDNGEQGIGYHDPDYNEEVLTSFIMTRKFYTLRDGKLKRISPRKAKKMLNGK